MSGAGKKWLLGCGIGCGLFVLIVGGIGTVGFFGVKKFADRADRIEGSFERMDAEYGEPSDFVPRLDGSVAPSRMEVFLAVRDEMGPTQREVSDLFRTLDGENEAGVIAKVKAGMKFIPSLLIFIEERNNIMLEKGIGVGEYQYIYSLAYYGLLGKDPSDGPGFSIVGDDEGHGGEGWRWDVKASDNDEEDVAAKREREVRRFVNRVQSRVIRNQLEALDEAGQVTGLDIDNWRAELAAETSAMDRESLRLLWEEGLPAQIRESLEPYRVRLDETYDDMTSILEMGLVEHD